MTKAIKATLEHANMTVRDPARTAKLMMQLFGWHIRWEGTGMSGIRAIHVGNEDTYLALSTFDGEATSADIFTKGRPLHHLGVLVDDLDAVETRVKAEGLIPYLHGDYEPGRRFYFLDHDGLEFEVVSYIR